MDMILDKAREVLDKAKQSDVQKATMTELPEGGVRIEIVLSSIDKIRPVPGKWAAFADALHRENPLRGSSELLCEDSREFRNEMFFTKE